MTTPVIHPTPYGWLATSPPGEPLRFAVTGTASETDTADAYARSLARWRRAADAARADGGEGGMR